MNSINRTIIVNSGNDVAMMKSITASQKPPFTPFASRADAESEPKPPTLSLVSAVEGGRLMQWVRNPAAPYLGGGWGPAGGVLDLRHVASVSDLSNDFSGIFEQAAHDAAMHGWELFVSQKSDGTPYEYDFIDHTLADNLSIQFEHNALLMPRQNFQHFATNGQAGPFTITEFLYDAAAHGPLSAMLVTASGAETKLDQGVGFEVIGNSVTLASAPPSGSTFVVTKRKDALQIRSSPGNGRRLLLSGDINIDLSRMGYAISSASGSGLTLTNIDYQAIERLWVRSPAGFGAHPLAKRGDSGFVPLGFKSLYASLVHVTGANDLAVYASGGGSSGPADDPYALHIGAIQADRCSTVMKYVRQGEAAYIGSINARECGTGFLSGVTGGIGTASGIHIGSINCTKLSRRALDVRDTPQGGLHVGAISVRDMGFMPDGVTAVGDAAGVFFNGVAGAQIDYLDIRQRDWPTPSGRPAVQVGGSNNHGNRINGGWVDGLEIGISETGSTVNDVGNSFTMTMKNVSTPISSSGALQTHYDIIALSESGGIVTQRRLNNLFGERQSGVPNFLLAGPAGNPDYAYTIQELTFIRCLDFIRFNLRIQGSITHTENARPLRIALPPAITNGSSSQVPVQIGRANGINHDQGDLFAEITPGMNDIRFYQRPVAGGGVVEITTDNFTSGTTLRFEVSGIVPA